MATATSISVPVTVLPTKTDAAIMLGVDKSTLGRHAHEAIPAGRAHHLLPSVILELNERFKRRLPGELAAELVDFAWARGPEHAPEVERAVNAWLAEHPASERAPAAAPSDQELLAALRGRLSPDEFEMVELLLARGRSAEGAAGPGEFGVDPAGELN